MLANETFFFHSLPMVMIIYMCVYYVSNNEMIKTNGNSCCLQRKPFSTYFASIRDSSIRAI